VVVPFPPYVVPRMENNAVLDAMVIICPWQSAQFFGAKLPAKSVVYPITPSIVVEIFLNR
jgi:hypothetical protein